MAHNNGPEITESMADATKSRTESLIARISARRSRNDVIAKPLIGEQTMRTGGDCKLSESGKSTDEHNEILHDQLNQDYWTL